MHGEDIEAQAAKLGDQESYNGGRSMSIVRSLFSGQSRGGRQENNIPLPNWTAPEDDPMVVAPSVSRSETVDSISTYHQRMIDLLFGLPNIYASDWPGILSFLTLVETYFLKLMEPHDHVVWRLLGCSPPANLIAGWEWCLLVLKTLRDMPEENVSVENVYERLIRARRLSANELGASRKEEAYRAIFAVLCWMSTTLKPIPRGDLPSTSSVTFGSGSPAWVEGSDLTLSQQDLRRPIVKMFRKFKRNDDTTSNITPSPSTATSLALNPSEIIYESSINYFSLHNIGNVRLEWVDTLATHLWFDRQTRTLSLFRFPTLCLLTILSKAGGGTINKILPELFPPEYYADFAHDYGQCSVHREVLLSYRLLFAQSARSRKLIKKLLSRPGHRAATDPLLLTLCCASPVSFQRDKNVPKNVFPLSTLDENGNPQHPDTYSVREDFPSFGSRLLVLQRYVLRQQPSKIKDLWRDRRNPLQWYTFWAVLWVGGITILLSILQVSVGIAQLYFAAAKGS